MGQILEYKGYQALVEYDRDDDIFVGKVLGINDSLNFHGKNTKELTRMFKVNYSALEEPSM